MWKKIAFKKAQKSWSDISPERIYKRQVSTWKNVYHPEPAGKCKVKSLWEAYILEWLKQ